MHKNRPPTLLCLLVENLVDLKLDPNFSVAIDMFSRLGYGVMVYLLAMAVTHLYQFLSMVALIF